MDTDERAACAGGATLAGGRTSDMDPRHMKYQTDAQGRRTAVVLPIAEYRQLLEDLHDLAVVAERRDEPVDRRDRTETPARRRWSRIGFASSPRSKTTSAAFPPGPALAASSASRSSAKLHDRQAPDSWSEASTPSALRVGVYRVIYQVGRQGGNRSPSPTSATAKTPTDEERRRSAGSPAYEHQPRASSPPSRTTSRTSRSKSSRRLRWLATATCRYLRPWMVETDGTAMPRSCSSSSISLLSWSSAASSQARPHVAEADDVERRRQRLLELRRGRDQAVEVPRLVDVLLDHARELLRAVLLERHPHLERVEAARELEPVVREPGHVHRGQPALALAVRQVRRRQRERVRAAPRASRTSTQPTGYVRFIHLCRSKASESARSMPATRCRDSGAMAAQAPKAPSTWNQRSSRGAEVGEAGQVVDRAGVGGAGDADDADGPQPGGAVAATMSASAARSMRMRSSRGHAAQRARAHAEQLDGLRQRRVRLRRAVDGEALRARRPCPRARPPGPPRARRTRPWRSARPPARSGSTRSTRS